MLIRTPFPLHSFPLLKKLLLSLPSSPHSLPLLLASIPAPPLTIKSVNLALLSRRKKAPSLRMERRTGPNGIVVRFAYSTWVAWGSWVWIPDVDLHTAHQATLWQHPTYKQRKMGTDVSSVAIFLKQKEENWLSKKTQKQTHDLIVQGQRLEYTDSAPFSDIFLLQIFTISSVRNRHMSLGADVFQSP